MEHWWCRNCMEHYGFLLFFFYLQANRLLIDSILSDIALTAHIIVAHGEKRMNAMSECTHDNELITPSNVSDLKSFHYFTRGCYGGVKTGWGRKSIGQGFHQPSLSRSGSFELMILRNIRKPCRSSDICLHMPSNCKLYLLSIITALCSNANLRHTFGMLLGFCQEALMPLTR